MKYIKTYENSEKLNVSYFYIPYNDINLIKLTLERYKDILKLNQKKIQDILNEIEEDNEIKPIYIFVKDDFIGYWEHRSNNMMLITRYINDTKAIYNGKLELEPHEVEAYKYNL